MIRQTANSKYKENQKNPSAEHTQVKPVFEPIACFHCGEDVPKNSNIFTRIHGQSMPMCCFGCKAVAEMICKTGMEQFYRQRTTPRDVPLENSQVLPQINQAIKSVANKKTISSYWEQFDSKEIQDQYVTTVDDTNHEIILYVNNIYCSACSWLIDKTLHQVIGVVDVKINLIEKTVLVKWQKNSVNLSNILFTLSQFGYNPKPILFASEIDTKEQRNNALKRLAISAFGMMQVMSYSTSLYLGEFQGITYELQRFFVLLSMLVATVVVFYSGKPFFVNAARDIRLGNFGMDVPIALAIGIAYAASVYSVFFAQENTIYFDSAIMFVFFLSISRYIEMIIRHRAVSQRGALNALIPSVADIIRNGKSRVLPVSDIVYKDIIVVAENEVFPVDGYLAQGFSRASVDESIITGESSIKNKMSDEIVLAGSRNKGTSVHIVATKFGKNTALANIEKLLHASNTEKPQSRSLTEIYARNFVILILVLAFVSGCTWFFIDSSRVFEIFLAVLIVSCPCALALASPAAASIAVQTLLKKGVLVVNSQCLSLMDTCRDWVFDKTGTLTSGKMEIVELLTSEDICSAFALQVASSLENSSSHPIAYAFKKIETHPSVENLRHVAGEGVEGRVDGVDYRIGNIQWVNSWTSEDISLPQNTKNGYTYIFLVSKNQLIAKIILKDSLRSGVGSAVTYLTNKNIRCHLLSGDSEQSVHSIALELNINDYRSQCKPDSKVQYIQCLKEKFFSPVAMVGDGVNDAPVLSSADIAISMGAGSDLAQSASDIIFLNNRLTSICEVFELSKKFQAIVHQNYFWSITYNVTLLPLAMFGLLTPWLAALGMSLSSLIVVLNATRISFYKKTMLNSK